MRNKRQDAARFPNNQEEQMEKQIWSGSSSAIQPSWVLAL